jgi:indole-3-glycerol phosphate synthase
VLLLLRDLNDGQCAALMRVAFELGLDTLVEAHDAGEHRGMGERSAGHGRHLAIG